MMKLFSITAFLLLLPSVVLAELRIACSTECDASTKRALWDMAKTMELEVRILNLRKLPRVDWEDLDGLIIPGGEDIDPDYYLPHVEEELRAHTRSLDHLVEYTREGARRDAFEHPLIQEYYSHPQTTNLPLLGLCRGMQMMTVALGIPLYVDIKTELGIPNRRNLYDNISVVEPDSLMHSLFGEGLKAYKFHHQGLRVPYYQKNAHRWPNVKVTAYSNQGTIAEALELSDRPALGVQFHPEADEDQVREKVFNWLFQKAKLRRLE